MADRYLPAAHGSHVLCPASPPYLPAAQGVQPLCPARGWCRPPEQSAHAEAPAEEDRPGAQPVQAPLPALA
jgi:hypothetical protein